MGIDNKTMPILRSVDIHKSYKTGEKGGGIITVLSGVNFSVMHGEIVSIIGASGSGKSTLLHILGGLDKPDEGKIYWNDTEITGLTLDKLALLRGKKLGFVFQFHHLLSEFSIEENIMLPILIQGAKKNDASKTAVGLLERFGLKGRNGQKPAQLSGGEQQRVAIARALANKPDVLLADEPTGNLDTHNSVELYKILLELNKSDGLTTVIVTHNKELAMQCDKTYQLQLGKLQQL